MKTETRIGAGRNQAAAASGLHREVQRRGSRQGRELPEASMRKGVGGDVRREGAHLGDGVRIVGTIAAKDIVDGVKNKTIVTIILTVAFLMVLYKAMPSLSNANDPPTLAVYDAGASALISALENNPQLNLRQLSSIQNLERYLGSKESPVLGLVLPENFDQKASVAQSIELAGYVDHWVSPSTAAELKSHIEHELTDLSGKMVQITVVQDRVFTRADGYGAFIFSLGMVVLISMFGLSVTPVLLWEEKQTKTLDSLLVSPATSGQIVMSKAITSLVYCLIGAALTLAFNGAMILQWGVVAMAVAAGSLFTIALGLLLGSLLETKQQISTVTFILYQPLLLPVVAGLFDELLPSRVIAVLNVIPTVALGNVFRTTFLERYTFSQVGPELIYVAGCAALILLLVAWQVRRSEYS